MTRLRSRIAASLAGLLLGSTALAGAAWPASAAADQARSGLAGAGSGARLAHVSARHAASPAASTPTARPGANLLANPGAQAGDASAQGWDSLTIPGWQVASGLPTVVRYGTRRFPRPNGHWPAVRGGHLFAGGAGGTARLRQRVPLRTAAGRPVPAGTRYRLAGWLGGTGSSRASVRVAFLSAAGRVLARRAIGPAGRVRGGLARRVATGALPRGTTAASVTVVLATSLKNIDGSNSPYVGYDRAVADAVRLSVSARVRRPAPLAAPRAHVPRYQHVFLFYFENEGFHAIIGNKRQAPYLNSLLPRASLLSSFFAEEHPSDANYLALAGGSAFGVPLTDPLEINPRYTIRARNIGDLIGTAHESWKTYLQSANGPCDDTVHRYYWDDDEPMTYFADVRDRPAYCSAHLVPLQALHGDLARTSTTPSFSWVSPDDCADMEGCGIRAGDRFLARQLGAIMRSPAWRTQRSLAIITFDEDAYNHQRPAQRVPTLILGSAGVRRGFVSHARFTHYSLLRTIEAALGLGTLTRSDRYARPVNDAFRPVHGGAADGRPAAPAAPAAAHPARRAAAAPSAAPHASCPAPGQAASPIPPGPRPAHPMVFVANSGSGTVTPVDLVTRKAGRAIRVGADPRAVAVAPDGKTAYVVNSGSGTVTPISVATRRAGPPIRVGTDPQAIAITPDGGTAYVVNSGSGSVTPINLASRRAGRPIPVGASPRAIQITSDGQAALVLDWGSAAVTEISTAHRQVCARIPVGSFPFALTIAPDGSTAYVASYGSNTVTPISIGRGRAGRPVPVGQAPDALAVTADGRTVFAVGGNAEAVTPVTASTGRAGRRIRVGYSPAAIAISRGTAYVVNTISGTLTPVSTSTRRAGRPISVGTYSYPTAITMAGAVAVVVDTYSGQATLVSTRTRKRLATIGVGSYPVAAAVAG
jgi:YVTN family beta-propeller protein